MQTEKTVKKLDYLVMDISYNIKKETFEITGNVNKVGQETILETFLRSQFGAGKDNSEPNIKDIYNIKFRVDLSYDIINVSDDTGNKGLRDGILAKIYGKLD